MKKWHLSLIFFVVLGFLDATFLTFEHFWGVGSPCQANPWLGDCGRVLTSSYSVIWGVPLAVVGAVHYSVFAVTLSWALVSQKTLMKSLAFVLATIGFVSSLYFVYLQIFVIGAICVFCMASAGTSTVLFFLSNIAFARERKQLLITCFGFLYQRVLKPLLFQINPTIVHESLTFSGGVLGKIPGLKKLLRWCFVQSDPQLHQNILGISFPSPIGLAAGFDYQAQLTQVLPALGFGFETVGTITNRAYEGNAAPMLGRLPKSRSLMVNKGFKNKGAQDTIKSLLSKSFTFPVGVSIGRTNSLDLNTQTKSVEDIIQSFKKFENSRIQHQYYELNISCPNLKGDISFYSSKNLHQLLKAIDSLKLMRPLFIKMPIEKSNGETLELLRIIAQHRVQGVIFGNLQKNRNDPALYPNEVAQFPVGNFSGKPTFQRSNELIALSYKHFQNRFVIIGCGGVFNVDDAYHKIKLGASLVQLITGLVFQGPQLVAEINLELNKRLLADGYTNISQAVGTGV